MLNKKYEKQQREYEKRRLWLATMWLLGASYRQLGAFEGVSHSSIVQSVNKVLPPGNRMLMRILTQTTPEAIEWYHNVFFSPTDLPYESPRTLASWLISTHPYPGD